MNKSRLMTEYKEIFGGQYIRNNGRWYWKANETAEPVLVMAGNLAVKIQEHKNKKSVSVPAPVVEKKEENFSPLPPVAKKPAPVKKKKEETVKVEETKTETKE